MLLVLKYPSTMLREQEEGEGADMVISAFTYAHHSDILLDIQVA